MAQEVAPIWEEADHITRVNMGVSRAAMTVVDLSRVGMGASRVAMGANRGMEVATDGEHRMATFGAIGQAS